MTTALASTLAALNSEQKQEVIDFLANLLLEERLPVLDEHRVLVRERIVDAEQNPEDESSVAEFMAEDW